MPFTIARETRDVEGMVPVGEQYPNAAAAKAAAESDAARCDATLMPWHDLADLSTGSTPAQSDATWTSSLDGKFTYWIRFA